MGDPNPDRLPEKIVETSVEKERGYLYYIDKEGDVSRVPAKWNEDPEFIEKIDITDVPDDVEIEPMPEDFTNRLDRRDELSEMLTNPEEEQENLGEEPLPAPTNNDPNVIYEDDVCLARLADRALTTGHVRTLSKETDLIRNISEDSFIQIMTLSSISASLTFESLKAQGTNIIVNQNDSVDVSIIPRFENDGLQLMWEMKQGDQELIKGNAEKIKSKLIIGEIKDHTKVDFDSGDNKEVISDGSVENKKVNIVDQPVVSKPVEKKKKNYLLDILRRIP